MPATLPMSPSLRTRTISVAWPGYEPWAETVSACRQEFVRVARSFWLIPELIPPVARDDVSLLYCLCRQLDDAVDEAPTADEARHQLACWKAELEGHAAPRPLIAAFLHGATRSGLPLRSVSHLLEGMAWDLELVRLADDDALMRYAYRVSSCVGMMLAPLLGVAGTEAGYRIVDLGQALQVSNILLGVEADAKRGRVYLPATRLAAAGLTAEDVLARPTDPRLRPVLQGLAELGDRYYASAQQGVATVPLRYRHGVLLLGRVYGELGRQAARQQGAPPTPKGLSAGARLQHLSTLAALGLHPQVLGLTTFPPHDPSLHRALSGLPGAHS